MKIIYRARSSFKFSLSVARPGGPLSQSCSALHTSRVVQQHKVAHLVVDLPLTGRERLDVVHGGCVGWHGEWAGRARMHAHVHRPPNRTPLADRLLYEFPPLFFLKNTIVL